MGGTAFPSIDVCSDFEGAVAALMIFWLGLRRQELIIAGTPVSRQILEEGFPCDTDQSRPPSDGSP
ncbi:hypothetical protein ACLBXB_02090 [Methylobacterium mesophilicum]